MTRGVTVRHLVRGVAVAMLLLATACASSRPPSAPSAGVTRGLASWYGEEYAGRATANGEIFDPRKLTAAHPSLPFGTLVHVTYPETGKSVQVRINDRGPFVGKRVIDLSWAAANEIGMIGPGVAMVEMRIVGNSPAPVPPAVAQMPATPPVIRDPVEPPPIAFPLPESAREPVETPGFRVEVEERRGPAPRQETPSTPRYVLQLGAFQQEQNAADLRRRAAAIDSRAFVQPHGDMFRVRVGPVSSREAAIELQEKFAAAGLPSLVMPE